VTQLLIHMVSCPLQARCSVSQGQYGTNCWSVGTQISCMQGISIDGKSDLHVIAGNLSGVRYRDEILHPIVRPYAGTVGDGFILMDDNVRPHRARVVTDYLENETIERMEWPSCSPDTVCPLNSLRSSSVGSMPTTNPNYCATTYLHATDKSPEAELWQSCPLFNQCD
jgi:hypothetical protein